MTDEERLLWLEFYKTPEFEQFYKPLLTALLERKVREAVYAQTWEDTMKAQEQAKFAETMLLLPQRIADAEAERVEMEQENARRRDRWQREPGEPLWARLFGGNRTGDRAGAGPTD